MIRIAFKPGDPAEDKLVDAMLDLLAGLRCAVATNFSADDEIIDITLFD